MKDSQNPKNSISKPSHGPNKQSTHPNPQKTVKQQKLGSPTTTNNHKADIKNPNKGTNGTNITYDKAQGNRGKQLNPNQKGKTI